MSKKCNVSSPPVYFTHYKLQKGLRTGLNLYPLNYRLARPGILSKGSARQDRKRGSHCGDWWELWHSPTSSASHLLCPVACTDHTRPDQHFSTIHPPAACPPPPLYRLCFDVTRPRHRGNSHNFPFISTAVRILLVTM